MKSPHTVGPFGLILVLLLGCNSRTPEIPPASSQPFMRLSEGEYLSSGYIDVLKSTRSAYEAGKTGQIHNIILHREGTTVLLEPIVNFHEGGTEFVIRRDGSVSSVDAATEYIRNPTARVLDDHTFVFGFGEFQPATYVFVNDATDYVSRAVLVGKYKDKQGRAYEFREDGWAVFPDHKFKFEIGVDHVLNDYDYFMEDKKRRGRSIGAPADFKYFRLPTLMMSNKLVPRVRTFPCGKCDDWRNVPISLTKHRGAGVVEELSANRKWQETGFGKKRGFLRELSGY